METVKRIGQKKHPILRMPFSGFPGAYIILSFKYRNISVAHINLYPRHQEPFTPDEAMVTFYYHGENHGAEWEPKYGPIMLYTKCTADWSGTTALGSPTEAKEHWLFDWVEDDMLAWSQLAVDREGLKEKLACGDFHGIFSVLKRWVEDR